MKFTVYVQNGKRGTLLTRAVGITGELSIDKDGQALLFRDKQCVAHMKEVHLMWLHADGFMVRGMESRGFDRQRREKFTYQEWFCRNPKEESPCK